MEQGAQPKKLYHSAAYLTSNAVFYGTLLFLIARVLRLFQLFGDAISRKQLGQAPPEDFTLFGILSSLLVIGVIGLAFFLLLQDKQKKLRLKRGNYYLLLNTLYIIWGAINAVSYLVEMVIFFEFVYLLDFITLIGALVLPSLLYQLADRRQDIPQDITLMFAAVGSTALSVIAALIVALVLRKSYTAFQLLRELMFRAGIILFGIAGLLKAIKLRNDLPALVAAMAEHPPKPVAPLFSPKPKQKKKPKQKSEFKLKTDKKGRIECPDCGKRLAPGVEICPRCGFDMSTPDLFDDLDDYDEANDDLPDDSSEEDEEGRLSAEEAVQPEPAAPIPDAAPTPSDVCPRCGRKIPPFLTTCPHCGYYPGDPVNPEEAEPEPEPEPQAAAAAAPVREQRPENLCEKCGRRIPGGLATCPYCGYHPADAHRPAAEEEPRRAAPEAADDRIECQHCGRKVSAGLTFCPHCDALLDTDEPIPVRNAPRLPRVPDPRRLTEKNSIVCPECNRRYPASRHICPFCGFDVYDI